MEAIGIVNWVISLCMVDRLSMEKQAFQNNSISWMDFPQVSACHISSVILTDIILKVLETVLSTSTNYIYIIASGPE